MCLYIHKNFLYFEDLKKVQAGILHGSILGAILSIFYTNDISHISELTIVSFSVDIALLTTISDIFKSKNIVSY